VDDLRRRWPARLASHTDLRDRLLAAYASPRRHYHDTRHLAEVLARLDALLAQPELAGVDRDTVVLAAWFHDAVYDGLPDDVERSAELAGSTLAEAGLPGGLATEVTRLVRLTLEHRPTEDDLAGQALSDADLAILAAGPRRYAEYVAGVREEYRHLDDGTFRDGRAEILRALLAEPRLFHTAYAAREWEAAARANVERELAGLSSPGPA
jgi:predicted metal-dependent HD superfamily phosphohydrolase